MEPIQLQTKEALDVYINPQRQNILRRLQIAGEPMTPKQLSDAVGISPSSVQHHIKKLLSIGVVELSHTERIHGITAKFYRAVPRTVRISGPVPDSNDALRLALMQNAVANAFAGYAEYYAAGLPKTKPGQQFGDMLYGILHLTPDEATEVYGLISGFLQRHERKTAGSGAWEYALIAYPVPGNQA